MDYIPGNCIQSGDMSSLHLQPISPVVWFAEQYNRLSMSSHVEL